jgi:phage-related protein
VTFQAIYYREADGNEPVDAFIDTLDPACQSEVDWRISLLNGLSDSNPELPFPHSSAIRGKAYRGLRELRAPCGRSHFRIIFQRSGRLFVLLHAFEKRSREIPERDKQVALERWFDFKARMDAIPRGDPRAIGHDAP